MTSITLPAPRVRPAIGRDRAMIAAAVLLSGVLVVATARHLGQAAPPSAAPLAPWLALHLISVVPAIPLGAYVLARRKGDRTHRLLGRLWVALMMTAALSSFGLHHAAARFSWIHLLSILTLVSLPRSILLAARGNIRGHMQGMRAVYAGLIVAGAFTFVPGRMLSQWLFG